MHIHLQADLVHARVNSFKLILRWQMLVTGMNGTCASFFRLSSSNWQIDVIDRLTECVRACVRACLRSFVRPDHILADRWLVTG